MPWFLTRLNEKNEQECTAFLRAFFKTAIAAARADTDNVTVTETGNTVRLEMRDDVVRAMLNSTFRVFFSFMVYLHTVQAHLRTRCFRITYLLSCYCLGL